MGSVLLSAHGCLWTCNMISSLLLLKRLHLTFFFFFFDLDQAQGIRSSVLAA